MLSTSFGDLVGAYNLEKDSLASGLLIVPDLECTFLLLRRLLGAKSSEILLCNECFS